MHNIVFIQGTCLPIFIEIWLEVAQIELKVGLSVTPMRRLCAG